MNEPIISVSGLRGIIGKSLDPILAAKYIAAFSSQIEPGPLVVTRDGRTTGSMLAQSICSAISASGRRVLYGDVAATPTTGVLVRDSSAAGGVQISASHNPPEYNGIKLFGADGRVVSATTGEVIRKVYFEKEPQWVAHSEIGSIDSIKDTTSRHLEKVLKTVDAERIRHRKFKVLLNSNHGAGSILAKQLLEELQVDFELVGGTPDGLFENSPEPTEKNLEQFCQQVASGNYDVGFAQDPDADRLAIVDRNGTYIGEEMTLALTLSHILQDRKGPVVINCATSRMSIDIAKQHDCECIISAVGEANVCDQMIAHDAVYGGEGNGGPIDPQVGYVRDSFVGMAQVLDLLAAREATVDQAVEGLPKYSIWKNAVTVDREKIEPALNTVETEFGDARSSRLDGLRLDWDDRWLLVRASNTEPIVRVIAEANSMDSARSLCENVERIFESI